jgi:hypothetical protein
MRRHEQQGHPNRSDGVMRVGQSAFRGVVIATVVSTALGLASVTAGAASKPKYPTTPGSYVPATVGASTVIHPGGACPSGTENPLSGGPFNEIPALAQAGVCQSPTSGVTQLLLVFSPAQAAGVAKDNANFGAKAPHVTKQKTSGVSVEVDQYSATAQGVTASEFVAFGTPVKGKILIQAKAGDEATALAEFQAMLSAALGKSPRLA